MKVKRYELMLHEASSIEWDDAYNKVEFSNSDNVYNFLNAEGLIALGSRPSEHLIVLALNVKGGLIGYNVSSIGEIASTAFSPRLILMFCVECNAASCIVAHNHPSGDTLPSEQDIVATKQLEEACRIMQIPLVDHLIVGNNDYTSFRIEGLLNN